MPKEKLNLFQLSTCTVAQAGTATAQVVWGEPVDPGTLRHFFTTYHTTFCVTPSPQTAPSFLIERNSFPS